MARIPQQFIDDLLDRLDIVDVIDRRVKLKKSGKNYMACCPFHEEKTPSFSVNPDKQFYYCFGCGASGNAVGFVMDYERIDFPEAIETLAQSVGLDVPRETTASASSAAHDSNKPLLETLEHAAQFYEYALRNDAAAKRAVAYLKQRGLTGEIAKRYRLGFAPPGWDNLLRALGQDESAKNRLTTTGMLVKNDQGRVYDRFRDRVVFPIVDQRGRVIAFGGRVLGDDKPKYLNSPETPVFAKSKELYGLYQARNSNRTLHRIVVVEGYMDVIALAQHGVTYAVATLGTATSETHLERLYRMTSEIVFCFDGDEAGRKAAFRALDAALPTMQDGREARFLFLPEGEDPDTLIRDKGRNFFEHLLDHATPLEEFLFAYTADGLDVASTQGRARWAKLSLHFLFKLPDGLFRELALKALANKTGIELEGLRRLQPSEELAPPAQEVAPFEVPSSIEAPRSDEVPVYPEKAQAPDNQYGELSYASQNPVHRLIGILVLKPQLASGLAVSESALLQFEKANDPASALLGKLLAQAQEQDDLSTAALLGYWYGTPEGEFLAELAGRELIEDDEGLEALSQALWGRLCRVDSISNARERLAQLRGRDYVTLTSEEKRQLVDLTDELRRLSGKN